MPDNRPRTRLGPIEFPTRFAHPPLDVSGGSQTTTHDVIGAPNVTDHLGRTAKSFTLRGHCDPETATRIDDLSREAEHELRHSRWSGLVTVVDHDTQSDGAFINPEEGILRYTYTIEMLEVVEVPD